MHLKECYLVDNNLKFYVHCKCGGHLAFSVNSASHNNQYICPNCSLDLSGEISHFVVNVKESLKHHCENCNQFVNVSGIHLSGKLI